MTAEALGIHVINSERFHVPRADSGATGVPTDEQLGLINKRISSRALTSEEVYVFGVEMSNTGLDSYGTWFDLSCMRGFEKDCRAPGGIPLFRNHATGGWSGAEDPHGRFFDAAVEDVGDGAHAVKGNAVPFARDLFDRAKGQHHRIMEWAFLLRDASPNGYANSEIIMGLDAGTAGAASIGATVDPVRAPGGDLICDVCEHSMFSRDCRHFPMSKRVVDDQVVIVTARFVKARQREGSLVPIGANPGAKVRDGSLADRLAHRAADLVKSNDLNRHEVVRLESIYGTNFLAPSTHSIPDNVAPGGVPVPDPTEESSMGNENRGDGAAPSSGGIEEFDALRAELTEARQATQEIEQRAIQGEARADVLERAVEDAFGIEEDETAQDALARGAALVTYGTAYRKSLMDRMAQAWVRAHGTDEGFDRDRLEARAEAWSPEQLQEEIEMLERVTRGSLKKGTPVPKPLESREDSETTPTPPRRTRAWAHRA